MLSSPSTREAPRSAPPALMLLVGLLGCSRRLELSEEVPKANPTSAWREVLEAAIRPEGLSYAHVEAHRAELQRYLAWVGDHGPITDGYKESAEDKRISFLVNAYNAWVIEAVLQNAPLASVQDLSFAPWSLKPGMSFFLGQQIRVDSDNTTLYRLERHSIVNRYQEPLLHVALNCASRGCPPLRWWPESGLQATLQASIRAWLATETGMQPMGDGYGVSEIFFWYEDDFLDWTDARDLCEFLAPYTKGERHEWLARNSEDCPLQRIPYDWSLNVAPAD